MKTKTKHQVKHQISSIDRYMIEAIENQVLQLAEFSHATHVKLAYCYLSELGLAASQAKMTESLMAFLRHNSINEGKFHVTLTQGWIIAVWHFMQQSPPMNSADEFLEYNPVLLNKDILLSHYSYELLYSEQARKQFVEPDLIAFPELN